jgi:hypothetical protein
VHPSFISKQQSIIITQLVTASASMHDVDELLRQLTHAIVRQCEVQLVQCWTHQAGRTGQPTVLLRTLMRQDPSLPERLVVNEYMARKVSSMLNEYRGSLPQPVETMFSGYQASILQRFGLHYCISYFLERKNAFLPPGNGTAFQEHSLTHFAMTTWLFLRQNPHPNLASMIGSILEQAITVAENRGLLVPAERSLHTPKTILSPQETLLQLIPQRRQDSHLLLESNPFAVPVVSDKKARRLHSAINGHTNVANLCKVAGMDMQTMFAALQVLLAQNLIEMYTSEGRLIDVSLFLNSL